MDDGIVGRTLTRVIVVDDEPLARDILRQYLAERPDLEVVAECANGFEAVRAVGELKPDLLFLDVQMPKLDGFEVLELLDQRPRVIFVTAYEEHAVRAFEVQAVDFLLKPYSLERFREVLTRALRVGGPQEDSRVDRVLESATERRKPLQRVLVREGSDIQVIHVQKLDYAEAEDDYVRLASGGKKYLKQQTLADLEKVLDSSRFVRIHRSFIVNLDRLARVELYAKDSRIAILHDGTKLPVSRSGYAKLKDLL